MAMVCLCINSTPFTNSVDITNVTGIAYDIIVFGSTEQEHDQAFVTMLEATRANNVSLNSAKIQFKQHVDFFGHTDAGWHLSCS